MPVSASMFVAVCGLLNSEAQVITQTNFGTGDMSVPGYPVSATDLLQTYLSSAQRTGGPGSGDLYFYREDSGYTVNLSRLFDGSFGAAGADPGSSVLPNQTTLTFSLDVNANPSGYTITNIRTFAAWDDGRDGQAYTVEYSTVAAPTSFQALTTVTRFDNTSFPLTRTSWDYDPDTGNFTEVTVPDTDYSHTTVELTADTGFLAKNVAQVRFVFNGVENGGTAYREFDINGSVTPVPEPTACAAATGVILLGCSAWRRWKRPDSST